MSKALSILISINVIAKSVVNLGGQGMVITNQGVAELVLVLLLTELLVDGLSFVHSAVYSTHNQASDQNKDSIVELESEAHKI